MTDHKELDIPEIPEPSAPVDAKGATKQLWDLFSARWHFTLKHHPLMATMRGDNRFNDKLNDCSPAAYKIDLEGAQDALKAWKAIDRQQLSGEDQLSYDMFGSELQRGIAEYQFQPWHFQANQMFGAHLTMARLVSFHPFKTAKDIQDYIARLKAFDTQIDQLIESLKDGVKHKRTQPAQAITAMLKQCKNQLVAKVEESPLYSPVMQLEKKQLESKDVSVLTNELKESLSTHITRHVIPAYNRLHDFLEKEYLPHARPEPGLWSVPGGKDYYDYLVAQFTTTNLTSAEVHDIGLKEVARLRQDIFTLMSKHLSVKEGATFADIQARVQEDKKNFYEDEEAPIKEYTRVLDNMKPKLKDFFGILPKAEYVIKPVEKYAQEGAPPAFYYPATEDGSRPAFFYVNTYKPHDRPRYMSETIGFHEGLPGHHLQLAIAQELKHLPRFRKHSLAYIAYIEGWGLYSEWLGKEMGFYQDPMQEFGRLNAEIWRSVRLVVDTGIHAFKWDRDKAIAYMKENTFLAATEVESEVDRYIVYPGQAVSYKIGQLKILEVNQLAKKALGEHFDYRKFHDQVLGHSALPLDVFEHHMKTWIESQLKH